MSTRTAADRVHPPSPLGPRHRTVRLALDLIAMAAVLLLTAAPAAARTYQSQLTEANGSALQNPDGLTVDGSDNLWVTEASGGGTVDKFSSSGTYEAQTASPPWSGTYIESAAFSEHAGKVFVSDSSEDDLWGLNPADASYASTDLRPLGNTTCCYIKVAADNSGGVANGDLYVSNGSSVVRINDETGAADNFTAGSNAGTNELTGPFSSTGALAVDSSGNLYIAGGSTVYEFEPSGELLLEFSEFEGTPLGSVTAIAVDPTNGNVLTAEAGAIDEFSASGESIVKITEANGASFGQLQGLAVDSAGTLYAADGGNLVVDVFGPAAGPSGPRLPLEVTVTGSGEVTSSPAGIACTEAGSPCSAEFKQGKTVTLTATPKLGNHFVKWSGACSENAATCKVTMSEAKEVSAEFAPTLHTLTITPAGPGSVSAGGTISGCHEGGGICSSEYQEGSTVTLTAAPVAHYHVTWSGCTNSEGNTCEVEIGSSDSGITATFTINRHTLTVTWSGSGSVSATQGAISDCSNFGGVCTGEYAETATVTLTATATHYHVTWSGCTNSEGNTCEVEIGSSDSGITAIFAPNKHTLAVTATGLGSVRANSGAISHCTSNSGTCAGEYIEAATVTLTATPALDQAVAWSGCTRSSANTCEVTIGASDAAVGATFAQITHTLTVIRAGSGSGSVVCNGGGCASNYPDGAAITLAASPASGSAFVGWSGADCSGTGACKVTIEADTKLTATFNANPEEHEAPPSNEAKPGSASQHGTKIALKLSVPGPGTISASGRYLNTLRATAAAPATLTLQLKMSAAGRKLLASKGKLEVKVTIVFTPAGGTSGTTTKTLTFKATKKR